MKKRWVILNAVVLVLSLGVVTSQRAQDVPGALEKSSQPRHRTAIALLRTINTAEIVERHKYGTFAGWPTLLVHNSQPFGDFIAMPVHLQQIGNSQFGNPPEMLAGWNLRMNVHSGGQGYDLLLLDMTDKQCKYALVTDESTVIRQSEVLGCGM